MALDAETVREIEAFADAFADEWQGKMGYEKSANYFGSLIDKNLGYSSSDLVKILVKNGHSDSSYNEARSIAIAAMARKPGWST